MKTVLLIGSGGREHALGWRLSLSPEVGKLIVAPGNDGMPADWERWPLGDFEELAERARAARVDLVVVGPDNPLADGIVDTLSARGLLVFGPTAAAARLEASKAFAKEVMSAAGVPTARYCLAHTPGDALALLEAADWSNGWVLKADGLALGKGVHVCANLDEARHALATLRGLGTAAQAILIEERLSGEEISWLALCDEERCALLEPARDFKRVFDNDQGPNTGGMGAFSPVPGIPAHWSERVRKEVFLPVLAEMKRRGTPFRGVLYAGLMADFARDRFSVLEFNARFGDPETQVLMARMDDDLYRWCEASARGDLSGLPSRIPFVSDAAVVVIAAAKGYPERPEKGARIEGDAAAAPAYFYAGVSRANGVLTANGGRVFGAMGVGRDLASARAEAYERVKRLHFAGMHYRSDIGGRT